MVSQDKLIKQGISYTDKLFAELSKRLEQGVKSSDTLEAFLDATSEYTAKNPLISSGYDETMLRLILQETNNHKFSRPSQKELARVTIEQYVGDLIVDVGEDIKESVREVVKDGYNNNLSQDEIAANISNRVSVIKNKRARAIARTEIARTATVSDYIINKERGATHWYVECRNTACPICKHAWHDGWTEENDSNFTPSDSSAGGKGWIGDKIYSMNNKRMLPPLHPNCRCVAYFIKKEEHESKVRSISPINFRDNVDTFEVLPYVRLTKDKIPNVFSDEIKKGFLKFDEKIQNAEYEYTYISNITTNEVGTIYSNKEEDNVTPTTDIITKVGDELLAAHNHRSPMPFNYKDFKVIFKNTQLYAKYLVVHTPADVFICELEPNARYYCEEIIDEINTCYGEGLRETGDENYKAAGLVWDKYKSNALLNKYMSFRRIRK